MKLKNKLICWATISAFCIFSVGIGTGWLITKLTKSRLVNNQTATINKISLLLLDNEQPQSYIDNILANNQQLIISNQKGTILRCNSITINLNEKIANVNDMYIELTCYFNDNTYHPIKLMPEIVNNNLINSRLDVIISSLNIYISNIYNNEINAWAFCKIAN